MPKPSRLRLLTPSDKLFRKLQPKTWDAETGEIADAAFVDAHPSQSFVVARKVSARELLERFARMDGVRKAHGRSDLTARDLYDLGYGVSEITAGMIESLGFAIERKGGHQYNKHGHVNVQGVKDRPWLVAENSRVLPESEIFPE
jgi:hypothetical protein